MPRLVLKDGMERRRCNVACDSCRKRKEKCDSRQPCAGCVKRSIDCVFAPPTPASDAPPAKRRRSKTDQEHESFRNDNESANNADSSSANGPRRWSIVADAPGFHANGMPSPRSPSIDTSEVPVPHMPRLLREQHGSVVYVGGSASLSFLQNVQHIVFSAIGECDFVTDPLLQSFLDIPPMSRDESQLFDRLGPSNFGNNNQLIISLEQADMLAHQFLIASSALLDLFDTTALFRSIQEWLEGNSFSELCRPVIYIVMAIGASVTATNGWDEIAEKYFNAGRQLAMDSLTMEPSLDTIQAFVLMALYMVGTTQTNAAFVTLGTAIRTAYAIGLHRSDLQNTFPEQERQSRERVWRSLRALDLFLSTALGRPCATTDQEKDIDNTDSLSSSEASLKSANMDSSLPSPAITGLCSIFERILTDVYKQQAVSIRVADDITRLYRQLSARLPNAYGSIPSDGPYPATYAELAKRVATTRVMVTYHWSIILLARPFLTAQISNHVQNSKRNTSTLPNATPTNGGSSTLSYAEFGIDSAIRSLDIAAELLQLPGLPRRLPFVTESIFNSALTVGAAFFGDFDRSYSLTDAMNKAQNLLSHLSTFDCQARRFQHFVATLADAAKVFMERRDRSSMENRQLRKNSIFGIVGVDSPTSFSPTVTTFAQAAVQVNTAPNFPTPSGASPNFSVPKIGTGDWSRAAAARPAPLAFPSPPDGDYNQTFHIADMVPTPPESRSEDQLQPGVLEQPHLDFLLRTTGSDFIAGAMTAHCAMSQGYQSEFNLLASEMSTDVDILPMFDLLGEPILF